MPMQETRIQSLGQEDSPEKAMATHFSILAWRIPQTEEPGRLQSMGSQRVRRDSNYHLLTNVTLMGFPGGPVVETLYFHLKGHRLCSWLGNQDPTCHAA